MKITTTILFYVCLQFYLISVTGMVNNESPFDTTNEKTIRPPIVPIMPDDIKRDDTINENKIKVQNDVKKEDSAVEQLASLTGKTSNNQKLTDKDAGERSSTKHKTGTKHSDKDKSSNKKDKHKTRKHHHKTTTSKPGEMILSTEVKTKETDDKESQETKETVEKTMKAVLKETKTKEDGDEKQKESKEIHKHKSKITRKHKKPCADVVEIKPEVKPETCSESSVGVTILMGILSSVSTFLLSGVLFWNFKLRQRIALLEPPGKQPDEEKKDTTDTTDKPATEGEPGEQEQDGEQEDQTRPSQTAVRQASHPSVQNIGSQQQLDKTSRSSLRSVNSNVNSQRHMSRAPINHQRRLSRGGGNSQDLFGSQIINVPQGSQYQMPAGSQHGFIYYPSHQSQLGMRQGPGMRVSRSPIRRPSASGNEEENIGD